MDVVIETLLLQELRNGHCDETAEMPCHVEPFATLKGRLRETSHGKINDSPLRCFASVSMTWRLIEYMV